MTPYAEVAKNLPSWLWKLGSQAFISKDYPRHIFIETTATCNLSCSYCPRERTRQDMDYGLFRQIVDEATQYGSRSFSLHLFGEPLLYPRIFEAIRYIKGRNPRHTVLLTTNGTKINDCIEDFVSCGIDQALWTWRPEARFKAITLLKLHRWGKFRVRFIDEITPEEAREEWKYWRNVEGRKMHNYGGEIDISKHQKDYQRMKSETVISMETHPKKNGHSEKSTERLKKLERRWPCYHLWLAPAVAWNGNILLCCSDPHQKEILGCFPAESVASVWQGPRLQSVRDSHLRGEYGGICTNCDVWKQYPDLFFHWQKKSA